MQTLPCRFPFPYIPFLLHHLKPQKPNPNLKPILNPYFFSSETLTLTLAMAPSSSSLVAEYAKSNRSTCKTCSQLIASDSLRLGVVTKDKQRGFNSTKWHHFNCLSFDSVSIPSVDEIVGYAQLKSDDQEALKTLFDEFDKERGHEADGGTPKSTKKQKVEDEAAGDKQKSTKKEKVEAEAVVDAQKSTKKAKLLASEDSEVGLVLAMSDIKDKYKEAILLPKWKAFHTIIFLEKDEGLQDSSKIAAFDFDGCLAKTSVKRIGADAWSLMYPSIPDKLKKLYDEGFKLVIFTNESNIDRWKNKRQVAVDSKVGRLSNFIMHVKVPIQVFVACGFDKSGTEDPYRKPKPGMWHIMEKHFNSGIPVDMDQSFYVGDAAGRENDHSDADIKFAQAVGLKFYVPEDFFEK